MARQLLVNDIYNIQAQLLKAEKRLEEFDNNAQKECSHTWKCELDGGCYSTRSWKCYKCYKEIFTNPLRV